MLARTYCLSITMALGCLAAVGAAADDGAHSGHRPEGRNRQAPHRLRLHRRPRRRRRRQRLLHRHPQQRIHKVDREGKLSIFRRAVEPRQRPDVQRRGRTRRLRDGRPHRRLSARDGKKVTPRAPTSTTANGSTPPTISSSTGRAASTSPTRTSAPRCRCRRAMTAVYYVAADGKVTRLIDDLPRPQRRDPLARREDAVRHPEQAGRDDGLSGRGARQARQGQGLLHAQASRRQARDGGDGLTVDIKGNLYITTGLGLQVFDPRKASCWASSLSRKPGQCHLRRQGPQDAVCDRPHFALHGADGSPGARVREGCIAEEMSLRRELQFAAGPLCYRQGKTDSFSNIRK